MNDQKQIGVCAQIWRELDRMSKKNPRPALRDIMKFAQRKNWNENNARTEYYAWRRAHGIFGRAV